MNSKVRHLNLWFEDFGFSRATSYLVIVVTVILLRFLLLLLKVDLLILEWSYFHF